MTFEELKEKALTLPFAPGVYIMRDKTGTVIYVGKAKKLKNRVSQYFQDTASHTPKTRLMVSHIDHFDVIVAASEFEALVLECSLIKRYSPKYNILLKDDKGYPYLRLNMKDIYPKIELVSKIADDGAQYFGPFGSRGVTQSVMEAIGAALKLPACKKQFPRDVGKDRPCLNYHMNRCAGWCQESKSCTEYRILMEQARQLLQGNYKSTADEIRRQMLDAAENLEFELAAALRDRLTAVEALGQKQLVTAGSLADTDVIGYAEQVTAKGLNMLYGPGHDLVSATALTAAGAHLVLFTTGRGTPFGAPAPTVKISTNSALANKKKNWIDFNAGTVADGTSTLEHCGKELLDYVLAVASGKKTCSEEKGFREISIFKDGVVL